VGDNERLPSARLLRIGLLQRLVALLGLSSAFDCVDHELLLRRLQYNFGFTDDVLHWMTSFVSGRTQQVSYNGSTQNSRLPGKIAVRLKNVCYKVSLCENCQRQSCKAFIGLTIRAKMIVGGDPFYLKYWVKLTVLERNRRFSI